MYFTRITTPSKQHKLASRSKIQISLAFSPPTARARARLILLLSNPNPNKPSMNNKGDGNNDYDDDDDFQDPIPLARSSLRRVASSQPLRPCNAGRMARPKKKSRVAGSSGKENCGLDKISVNASDQAARALRQDLDCGNDCVFAGRFGVERGNLSVPVAAEAVDRISRSFCSLSEISVSEAPGTGIEVPSSTSSLEFDEYGEKLGESTSIGATGLECEGNRDVNFLNPDGSCVTPTESNSVESESGMHTDEVGENFEPGTQLNELMNLCAEWDSQQDVNIDGDNGSVECPLCGHDLSGLSELHRQLHTNNCLDGGDAHETRDITCNEKSCLRGGDVDRISIIEWLKNLGLSRYEEIFIREEIDSDALQWLTEEDLLNIGITALGPRKKIINSIKELHNKIDHSAQAAKNNDPGTINDERTSVRTSGNKLITEYFRGSVSMINGASHSESPTERNNQTVMNTKMKSGKRSTSYAVGKEVPPWCLIAGTPFRVDAFRYLSGACLHWFLTHFHLDHYQGLTKNFCHGKIYCSSVTARLINLKIGIPWEKIHILPLNQKIIIRGVGVTCIDANHCPGAVMILFEPPNGKAVLHTGDFRFTPEMGDSGVISANHIHTLILDTTYCSSQYNFPKQEAAIQFVIEAIQAKAFNPKTLFLIGSYTIGKEKLFVEVGRLLKKKIYVGSAKMSVLRCLELPEEDMNWLTSNEAESHIHVVPMWTLASFKRLKHISNQYTGLYDLIVAFSPTGWTFGKGRKRTPGRRCQNGTVIRYEVPYSEHCSFDELRAFVRLISPEYIIPSVNNDGPQDADAMRALLLSDT